MEALLLTGNAGKGAAAIIAAVDGATPPLRLVLGSTAHRNIAQVLNARRQALEAEKNMTLSCDVDP